MSELEDLFDRFVASRAQRRREWSLEDFCGGHVEQLAFCKDRSQLIHAMCARQSGKTQGDDAILFDNAKAHPRSTNVFLGLVGTGVRLSNWFPVWKPLCERYGVPDRWHNEQTMLTTLDNQARVVFGGTDDLANIKKLLGNRLDNSVFIIDECQDQRDSMLHYILNVLLPPMMTPTTRVILSGVLPDVEAGEFYDLATPIALADAPEMQVFKGFSHHEWGRAANVHTPEAMEQLKAHMEARSITEDDPQIARDWFMRRKWDLGATAYKYRKAINGYTAVTPGWLEDLWAQETPMFKDKALLYCHPMRRYEEDSCLVGMMAAEPLPGVEAFSFAIDPGATTDRVAIEGIGWGKHFKGVQHVFDYASPRGVSMSTSQIYAIAGAAYAHFRNSQWRYDAGSSQNTIDHLTADFGLPVILAARKGDLKGQVDRNADLLQRGEMLVMLGSALEQDYQRAAFDPDARKQRIFRWKSNWHPDPSEAGRYALQDYFETYKGPPPPPTIFDNPALKALMRNPRADAPRYK